MEETKVESTIPFNIYRKQLLIVGAAGMILIMAAYRKGLKHGYANAMGVIDATIKTILDSFEISHF